MGTQLNRIVENKTNGDIQSTLTFLVNTEDILAAVAGDLKNHLGC